MRCRDTATPWSSSTTKTNSSPDRAAADQSSSRLLFASDPAASGAVAAGRDMNPQVTPQGATPLSQRELRMQTVIIGRRVHDCSIGSRLAASERKKGAALRPCGKQKKRSRAQVRDLFFSFHIALARDLAFSFHLAWGHAVAHHSQCGTVNWHRHSSATAQDLEPSSNGHVKWECIPPEVNCNPLSTDQCFLPSPSPSNDGVPALLPRARQRV